MFKLIFLLFTYCSSHTFAGLTNKIKPDECKNVDLSDQFGPIRYQGLVGACYAFVAADLIGFNQRLPKEQMVSARDVQLNYLIRDPKEVQKATDKIGNWDLSLNAAKYIIPEIEQMHLSNISKKLDARLDFGSTILALLSYNASPGLCLESELPSQGRLAYIESDHHLKNSLIQKKYLTFESETSEQNCLSHNLLQKTVNSSKEIVNVLAQEQAQKIMDDCKNRIAIKPIKPDYYQFDRGAKSRAALTIAYALKMKIPVAIAYDSSLLKKGPKSKQEKADHASTVVGTRWNKENGQCEFKIRNSWGINCDLYHKEIRKNCVGGNIWISEKDINLRTAEITALESEL